MPLNPFTFGDFAFPRLLLCGAVATLLARSVWGVQRLRGDRVMRLTAIWALGVVTVLLTRNALAFTSQHDLLVRLVRFQYFGELVPIPFLLHALRVPRKGRRAQSIDLPIVASAVSAALVWIEGPVFRSKLLFRATHFGAAVAALEPGPLMPWVLVTVAIAFLAAVGKARVASSPEQREVRTAVIVGGLCMVPAGINDALHDSGMIRSVHLIELACATTLLVIASVFWRRVRLAFGDTRARIEHQTRELEAQHNQLAEREKAAALDALSAGFRHELNNPLSVVRLNLERIRELATSDDAWRAARACLARAMAPCRAITRVITPGPEPASGLAATAAATASEIRVATAAKLRVLVVDDDPLVARVLRRTLREHTVTVAHSGAEAVEIARGNVFDCVLCDVMMPGMTGPEVHRALRDLGILQRTGFVFVTGGAFVPDIATAVERSGAAVLHKPFDPGELLRLVHALSLPKPEADEVASS